jgi:hypothetical protein
MTDSLSIKEQKKVLRTITRLKHSLAADREIDAQLAALEQLGTEGVVPRLETTLAEVLGTEGS